MKLERFQEENKKKKVIIIGSIVLVFLLTILVLYRSFALFEENQTFDVIKGSVPEQNYDIMLSFTIEDESGNKQSSAMMPEGRNYNVTVTCSEGAKGSWDYNEWGPNIRSLTKNRTKCNINFAKTAYYQEEILNGTEPVLANGLIPVTIDNDGIVQKADESKEWYNYGNQRWANAVLLEDESISYQNGEVIPESNIESYFVWIPKYRYKLWDLGKYEGLTSIQKKEQTIDLIFGDYDTVDKEGECKTPGASGASGNCSVGDYMTHPAFQAFGTKGLWVGKFETGYKGATNSTEAEKNIEDTEKVEIKPNVYSWRGIQLANMHLNSYNYRREYESHMMKNTEWGAVAYLQHSVYGSRNSVRVNNNSSYITGYSSVNEPTCGYTQDNRDCNISENTVLNEDGTHTKKYNSEIGYLASTTGNISGIYDMSGGSFEYVMGVMLHSSGVPCAGRDASNTSGFTGPFCNTSGDVSGHTLPEKKYYDVYEYADNNQQFYRRILGDATGELGPFNTVMYARPKRATSSWHSDEAWFVNNFSPWFSRGGFDGDGLGAGIFEFITYDGRLYSVQGYRIVLAI